MRCKELCTMPLKKAKRFNDSGFFTGVGPFFDLYDSVIGPVMPIEIGSFSGDYQALLGD